MPSSPIMFKNRMLPDNWKELEKVIIPDSKTAHYYGVWFDDAKEEDCGDGWVSEYHDIGTASLMCCHIEEDPSVNDNWYHVEDLEKEHTDVVDIIRSVFGISFHENIWVEMGAKEVFPARSIPSGPVAIGKGETWDGE